MSECNCKSSSNKLSKLFNKHKNMPGSLIPLLQEAQDIYGHLPKEVMLQISKELKIPFSKVFGVATFYSQFHLTPRGRHIIRVCTGTACHVRGADLLLNGLQLHLGIKDGETTSDLRFTLETVACLGACGLAPAIMINDETYGRLTTDEVAQLLKQYK